MNMINIKINDKDYSVPASYTILDAAREAGIKIPTLCYLKDMNEIGACRMCLVEIKGARALQAACVYPVSEGLEIYTNTPKVRKARRNTLELILSNHEKKCLTCIRNRNCELQTLADELGWSKSKLYYVIRGKGNAKKLLDHLKEKYQIIVPLTYEGDISVADSNILTY